MAASFPNSAYLGVPIMMYLFKGNPQVMLFTTLAIILPTIEVIMVVTILQFSEADKTVSFISTLRGITLSVIKTPIISASIAGILFSFASLQLPDFLAASLKNFGMASIPCALFAVGILIVKLKMKFRPSRTLIVNIAKLVAHPIIAAVCLLAFGINNDILLMGILLAGLPPATLVNVMAETYSVCEAEMAATLLSATLLYIPALYATLTISGLFGLTL